MSSQADVSSAQRSPKRFGPAAAMGVVVLVLLGAMAWDTTVVSIDAEGGGQSAEFSGEQYGEEQFPHIREDVANRAIDAETLAADIAADQTAAGEEYGVPGGIGPIMPVRFSGVVGEGASGTYEVDVEGLPEGLTIRVQTGPAINGTDLRDATGEIEFGQFTNQIEYQDAGSGINEAMKEEVLAEIDTNDLSGKTVEVTGVFQLINPNNWLVTPVSMSVE
ncbi:DUF2291 family protein [Aidingimonas lacisalsi]|uniref:DUF2291 family protein n=1 Tax=Aidingimonas lacisalsi TaxID=2604086 RepID=UPI0011D19023|nr:DUF2291 domain-containing protein [Aidingimonas lacisalsi]